jgi:hypothetical protein
LIVIGGILAVFVALVILGLFIEEEPNTPGEEATPSADATGPRGASATEAPDCSGVTRPAQGSTERSVVVDAIRRHENYEGQYAVRTMTTLRDWAYVEATPYEGGALPGADAYHGYLAQLEDGEWKVRWEGSSGAEADGSGEPPYPSGFSGDARDVLRC